MSTLFVTDLDGTLLGADARISQESAALLRPMLDEGLPLAVATARSPATVVELLRPLGLRTPAVLMTGTMIYDVAHTRCLSATPLARETAAAVCAVLERTGQEALAYSVKGGHLYVYYKEFACDFERSFVSSRIHSPYKTFVQVEHYPEALAGGDTLMFLLALPGAEEARAFYDIFSAIPGLICYYYSDEYGSGGCLLPLYFAIRDFRPRLARLLLALALLSGFGAGFARVVVGAHFPSHVFAALALDWLISAGIYIAAFDRAGLVRKLRALLPFGRRSTEDQPGRVTLYLFTSLWWAIVFNGPMTAKLAIDNNLVTTDSLILSLGTTAAFAFVSAAIIELCGLLPKMVFRILLLILNTLGAAAFAAAYLYGTAMTPDMVRNFLATDPAEAQAYLSTRSVLLFLAAWLPPMLVTLAANLKKSASTARPTLLRRLLIFLRRLFTSIGFAAVGVALIGLNFQAFAGAMRNDKSLRYMIAPVNVVYSGMRTIVGDSSPENNGPRVAVDPSPSLVVKPSRPAVLVVMVGETTRSASWQLAGYSRETNPQLSELQIISIPRVEACGTSTDVSLPCMMSRIGRSDYNRDRILSEEQLPSLLNRAGANVLWIDNQSGCKGACTGVNTRATTPNPQDCPNGECGDRVFLSELKGELGKLPADRPTVLFLHMMGSHGPAYSLRSDKERKLFEPECTDADLKSCSRESVMNAYDNSVRETDYVLASLIRMLKDTSGSIDSALVYVSDHGESLGEGGLYLHGAPYWMAPKEQTEVPMVLWMNSGFEKTFGINRSKLEKNAAGRVTHENLYHTVLGLLNVKSTTYVPTYDLTH